MPWFASKSFLILFPCKCSVFCRVAFRSRFYTLQWRLSLYVEHTCSISSPVLVPGLLYPYHNSPSTQDDWANLHLGLPHDQQPLHHPYVRAEQSLTLMPISGLSLSDELESPLGIHLDDTIGLALGLCLVILIHDVILDALCFWGQWMPIFDEHYLVDPCAYSFPPSLSLWSVSRHLAILS